MRSFLTLLFALCILVVDAKLPKLIPYRKGNLWGYCDSTKRIVIEPQWAEVGFFTGSCARVWDGNGYGLIDTTGKYVQPPLYEWMEENVVHGLRQASTGDPDGCGMFDINGKEVVPFRYQWFHWEGVLLQACDKKCRVGVFDSTGRTVIPFKYKSRGDFPTSMGDSAMFALRKKGKWGVIDTSGKIIIPFRYYWIDSEGPYWAVCTSWGECTYYSSRGVFLGDSVSWPESSSPHRESLINGRRMIKGNNGLFGFEDEHYRVVIQPKYLGADDFNAHDLAMVSIRKGYCEYCWIRGYIDKDGTEYWED